MKTFTQKITKEELLEEIKTHRKNDQLIKGVYGEGKNGDWRGCAVGCSIHSINHRLGKKYATNNHVVYEIELGIPVWLARLEDTIFEGLPDKDSQAWPEKFIKAIPVGIDEEKLEMVKWKFCSFIFSNW